MGIDRQSEIGLKGELFTAFLGLFVNHFVCNLGDLLLGQVDKEDEQSQNPNKYQGSELEPGGNLFVAGLGDIANSNVGACPNQAGSEGPDDEGLVSHLGSPCHNWHQGVQNRQEPGYGNGWTTAFFNEHVGSGPVILTEALAELRASNSLTEESSD